MILQNATSESSRYSTIVVQNLGTTAVTRRSPFAAHLSPITAVLSRAWSREAFPRVFAGAPRQRSESHRHRASRPRVIVYLDATALVKLATGLEVRMAVTVVTTMVMSN